MGVKRRQRKRLDYRFIERVGEKFRAAVHNPHTGKIDKGPVRVEQLAAHEDALEMRKSFGLETAGRATIRQAIDLQLRLLEQERRSEGTRRFYVSHHRTLLRFWPGGRRALDDITRDEIRHYIDGRRRQGAKDSTIRHEVTLIGRLFKLAIREGWVTRNPIDQITKPSASRAKPEALTFEEVAEIVSGGPERDGRILRLLFATGLRLGEAARLTVSDVELQARTLRVREGKSGPRTLPIPDGLAALITQMREETGHLVPGDTDARREGSIQRACRRAKARLDDPRLHPHTFRHSTGSHLARCGFGAHLIAAVLGHSLGSSSMTQHYIHAFGAQVREAMEALWKVPGHGHQSGFTSG